MNQELTRKNLIYFRKENNLTQAVLAKELMYSRSTISEYESGKKPITDDAAMRMAEYFEVEYTDFISCNFEDMERMEIGSELFYDNLALFLPIVKSEQALKNTKFTEAVEMHEKIYVTLKRVDASLFNPMMLLFDIRSCVGKYLSISNDPDCSEEAFVNSLGLIMFLEFWMSSARKVIESIDNPNITSNKLTEKAPGIKIRLESAEEDEKKQAKLAIEAFLGARFKNGVSDIIQAIKQSSLWKDVGDYYLAMRYVWGSVDNDLSPGMNYRIGNEMLLTFADVGNPYAAAVLSL